MILNRLFIKEHLGSLSEFFALYPMLILFESVFSILSLPPYLTMKVIRLSLLFLTIKCYYCLHRTRDDWSSFRKCNIQETICRLLSCNQLLQVSVRGIGSILNKCMKYSFVPEREPLQNQNHKVLHRLNHLPRYWKALYLYERYLLAKLLSKKVLRDSEEP